MKITIVTVSYNSEKTIGQTIESVLMQRCKNYEYIVVDGKSSDKTLEIIKDYELLFKQKKIPFKVISENDAGIFDAMNKGIKLANGQVLGFLNSDDIFADCTSLQYIEDVFKNNPDIAGVYGNIKYFDFHMEKTVRTWISKTGNYKHGWLPPHPTLYIKKQIYNEIGGFDLNYKICSDYDFMIRLLSSNHKLQYIDKFLVYMRINGVSTNGLHGYWKNFLEVCVILKRNKIPFSFCVACWRIMKTFLQYFAAIYTSNNN